LRDIALVIERAGYRAYACPDELERGDKGKGGESGTNDRRTRSRTMNHDFICYIIISTIKIPYRLKNNFRYNYTVILYNNIIFRFLRLLQIRCSDEHTPRAVGVRKYIFFFFFLFFCCKFRTVVSSLSMQYACACVCVCVRVRVCARARARVCVHTCSE